MLSADTFQAFTQGDISQSELEGLASLDALLKVGSIKDRFKSFAHSDSGKAVGSALLHGAAGAGTVLAGDALMRGGKKLWDKATFGRDMKGILAVYPHLKDYPEKDRRLAYQSLRHMNPHFAKDPLVGGTLLGQILRQRDPSNPDSIRFDGSLASDLVKSRVRDDDPMRRAVVDAMQRGVAQGLDRHHRKTDAARDRAQRLEDMANEQTWRAGQSEIDRKHRASEGRANRRAKKLDQLRGHGLDKDLADYRKGHMSEMEGRKQQDALRRMAYQKELDWLSPKGESYRTLRNPDYDSTDPRSVEYYDALVKHDHSEAMDREGLRAVLRGSPWKAS